MSDVGTHPQPEVPGGHPHTPMTDSSDTPTRPEREVPIWAYPDDLERLAKDQLSASLYDNIAGGAGDELTVRANLRGFERFYLRPRILVDVSAICTEIEILGTGLSAPIFIAPMGGQQRAHPLGEVATAKGAGEAGVGFMLSTESSVPLEEVARHASAARWFQLYFISSDHGFISDIVARATQNGYKAIVVTVDAPVANFSRRNLRHEAEGRPGNYRFSNYKPTNYVAPLSIVNDRVVARFPLNVSDPALTWKDIEWLVSITALPVLVKGVMTAEDARIAIECGISGIVVSNHGGRALDHTMGSVEALPDIVEAVGDQVPIILDGGVRRPTDIAIALGLGAKAVAVGRPTWWALAYGGSLGVASFYRHLVMGLARTMAWMGIRNVSEFTPSSVGRR